MRSLFFLKILTLASLGLMVLPSMMSINLPTVKSPVIISYNPPPANNFHAPLSAVSLIAETNSTPALQSLNSSISVTSQVSRTSSLKTIQQNALRFITDDSYFPQSESSIAIDPKNPSHVVGGFNDEKYFFCPFLPRDCGNSTSTSLSGFTTSTDGGRSVAKTGDLPNFEGGGLVSWGDPSLAPTVDGNFFYASLLISPGGPFFGNAVMIAKSNSNFFNPSVSCSTQANPESSPCWNAIIIFGTTFAPVFTLEDKDRIAVDRNSTSPYYGSVYIGWDHFFGDSASASYLARCDGNLVSCVILSGGIHPVVSGNDSFVAWTTPLVDKSGNVYVAWCNFGRFNTFGPIFCRIASSPPGGTSFGQSSNILSYMGKNTDLPTDTVVIGWATEQFRTGPGLISLTTDMSSKSNNLYFTTNVCVSGHYDAFLFGRVQADNPGNCGASAILFSKSSDNGLTWSSPSSLSNPLVNDQPFVTVDSETGFVYVLYYTTQYDPFDHRIDVVASISNNQGKTFHQDRITSVSDEPNSDPNMFNYMVPGGAGGSLATPQYGDYFEATAQDGTLYVLFTGNYAVEAGTYQTDPYLAVVFQN